MTNSPKVMERAPAWSPDGRSIAYFSDESGEYALHVAPQAGIGDVLKIPMPEPGFYRAARWSPDSKKLAFTDSHMRIWYVDVATRKTVQVGKERYWNPLGGDWAPIWSPDSQWLAFATRLPNYLAAIHLYSLASGKTTQITDGMSDAKDPVFDKDGRYLYFTASTDSGPSLQPDVGSFSRPVTSSIYIVVLSRMDPSPLAPESDEEKIADAAPPPASDDVKRDAPPAVKKSIEVKIDFEHIGQRILSMPLPPRRYSGLQVGKPGVLFALETPPSTPGQRPTTTVHRYEDAQDRCCGQRPAVLRSIGERRQDADAPGRRLVHPRGSATAAVGRRGRWLAAAPGRDDWAAEHEDHRSENLAARRMAADVPRSVAC